MANQQGGGFKYIGHTTGGIGAGSGGVGGIFSEESKNLGRTIFWKRDGSEWTIVGFGIATHGTEPVYKVAGIKKRAGEDGEIWLGHKGNTWNFVDEEDEKKEEEKIKFDLSEIDKSVLPAELRHELISVLKQHEKGDILFNKWGLAETIEYGKGMTMLFWGSAGTGKTWTAKCIAKATGLKFRMMDTAALQSFEPGGMERNLKSAFEQATRNKEILFFDECDSLLFNRNQVGMILGAEINTLLTELEKFEGICILSTNRVQELDKALQRRISFIAHFPKPDFEARVKIWERLIPKKFPLHKEVSVEKLAEYDLTGGLIKNVLISAARLALAEDKKHVEIGHFETAIQRVIEGQAAFKKKSKTIPHGEVVMTEAGIGKKKELRMSEDEI